MEVSKVEVVVLGLLADQPMHGYELLERFRERGMDHWADVAKASVYQAMHRLDEEGAISSRLEEGTEGPDRRVFRIARPGRERLRRGVAERLGPGDDDDTATALGFIHHLNAAESRSALARLEAALKAELGDLDAIRAESPADRSPGRAVATRMLERRAALIATDLSWLAQFRRAIGRIKR